MKLRDRAKGCAELDGACAALMLRFLHKSHCPAFQAAFRDKKAVAILLSSDAVMWKLNWITETRVALGGVLTPDFRFVSDAVAMRLPESEARKEPTEQAVWSSALLVNLISINILESVLLPLLDGLVTWTSGQERKHAEAGPVFKRPHH